MINHQMIPYPTLTGDAERDIASLHEYVYKLQEMLLFTLRNLDLRNVNRNALDKCEMRTFDGGVWIGTKLENGKLGKDSNGIIIYPDKGAKKITNGTESDF